MIKLKIDSIDKFGERTVEEVEAIKIEEHNSIIYRYSNEYGKTMMRISEKLIEIIRTGEIESSQIIIEGETTDFIYKTPYIHATFQLYTKKVEYKEKELTIYYSIYDNNVEINKLKIRVRELSNEIIN
ncbi:MAG: DUF1934 domain-containing protein [Cetobacterium sp.]|nr:DUF1934 domain-containing protein [Cetobacterium sp.]